MNLSGKTVLLLAPKFFGYELEIKKERENLGAKVIYFDERPKNDFFTKVFIRLNLKSFISKKIDDYYKNIIQEIKDESIDFLFLILEDEKKGEKIILLISNANKEFIQELKEKILKNFDNKLMIPSEIKIVEEIPKLGSGKKDFVKAKYLASQE